ncbi:zinc finger CCCH domain-containing protein 11A isoform X1 [Silurus meridionalis]|uniref:zinc finger CCCH domain-containing protein 11A isoform X1 n=1 Tax=Silurus meridionalis TaxID=175797 RepID=UPI001EECBC5E|nr:zinc finger CCCH domain-containing protein 11A isoform X1 [Silurus meridionalis]XP_046731173.1 zinc finger CCCH domain-containing protein 11A isoform X1 [Silurus meridionalis]XP_046731175.1 zinc finger CCCH domain-containing protein 11A isoform X1 [Silurus meridionalis]
MSNKGDDCYFYYYSTCSKGDACPFRHCEAAMGNETVCGLWQENRCFRNICKYRHMEIKKNRKEIPCYWENQPGGCQKSHCAFHHEKPRFIDGLFVAPDKGPVIRKEREEEMPQVDHASSPPANVSSTTNPQLRGVIKVETQESVPSPTHPPVVINPVDDEDDEDVDQFSEEGEEASGVSPKKLLSFERDDSLNFGIKTLEEIRLGKALKASLNRAGHPFVQGSDCFASKRGSNGSGTEKEIIQSVSQMGVVNTIDPALGKSRKRKITDRLGKKSDEEMVVEGGLQLKGSLAKRLGEFVDSTEDKISMPPEKVLVVRSVRERLGITSDGSAPKTPNSEPKGSSEIRIKTLEEIRLEKASKSQMQNKGVDVVAEALTNTLPSTKKVNKPVSGHNVKTFSEILHEKKKLQETKVVPQQGTASTEKTEGSSITGVNKQQAAEIRVKTLEEIRKEKAARMQAKTQDTTNDAPSSSDSVPKRRILCIGKTGSARSQQLQDSEKEKVVDCPNESSVTNGKSETSIQDVTVKSFEEIMREKKLRKQQEQAASSAEPAQAAQKPIPELCEKKTPAVIRQGISIQANSSLQEAISQQTSPAPSVALQRKSPELQNMENALNISPTKSSASMAPPVQVSEMADSSQSQEPHWENTQGITKVPHSKSADLKVRPKLNVKPSVMRPTPPVKPGQKRKTAGIHGSAVAAVKPLNAVPDPAAEKKFKQTQLSAPSCTPLEVEARVHQASSPAEQGPPDPPSVPKSPVIKTPTQTRPRRASLASARGSAPAENSSTVDDFEDLLDEFTDDRLEDEIELDPGKGEDDLLLELSEMIDS